MLTSLPALAQDENTTVTVVPNDQFCNLVADDLAACEQALMTLASAWMLPEAFAASGQPVLIGGSMGTESWVLTGDRRSEEVSLSSACHGAGRAMSRHQAAKRWTGAGIVKDLADQGIIVKSPSRRGIAEEAPGAYKSVTRVVDVAEKAGLARRVARLKPMICIKG